MSYAAPLFSRLARSLARSRAYVHADPRPPPLARPDIIILSISAAQRREARRVRISLASIASDANWVNAFAREIKRTLYERFETHGDHTFLFPHKQENKEFENLIFSTRLKRRISLIFLVCSKKNDNYFIICRRRRESIAESGGI